MSDDGGSVDRLAPLRVLVSLVGEGCRSLEELRRDPAGELEQRIARWRRDLGNASVLGHVANGLVEEEARRVVTGSAPPRTPLGRQLRGAVVAGSELAGLAVATAQEVVTPLVEVVSEEVGRRLGRPGGRPPHDQAASGPHAGPGAESKGGAGPFEEPARRRRPAASDPSAVREAGDLPIPGYDELSAVQVVERLAALRRSELEAVLDYEEHHRGRRTITNRAHQLLERAQPTDG